MSNRNSLQDVSTDHKETQAKKESRKCLQDIQSVYEVNHEQMNHQNEVFQSGIKEDENESSEIKQIENNHCKTKEYRNSQNSAKVENSSKSSNEGNEQTKEKEQDEKISEYGQVTLEGSKHKIHLLTIIGEIEGHECLSANSKTTKYEHILPQLALIEDNSEIDGLLLLINTVGGDVESGLAIAEMISSLTKPTVSLVLGGGHSIGVPLAVSTDYSFIVPSGTMIIHPVRMSGTVIGAQQTYDYFKLIQDRILGFVEKHCHTSMNRLEEMMMNTGILTKDLGTILVGEHAVKEGLIDEVGGIKEAMKKLHEMIDERKENP